jgi:serine/threonine protein kinase
MDIKYISSGSYGVIMKKHNIIIKQQYNTLYESNKSAAEYEVELCNLAYSLNPYIFIKILKYDFSRDLNMARSIGKQIPLINCVSLGYSYIYMENMDDGDFYDFIKKKFILKNLKMSIIGILGCYINGLYILHNKLNIIHGDLTPNNILVKYIDRNYKQKIYYDNNNYNNYIDTFGYMFKIADFGLARKDSRKRSSYILRDFLMLYYLYFYKSVFYDYYLFEELILNVINKLNNIIILYTYNLEEYNKVMENYNNLSIFLNEKFEIDNQLFLLNELPKYLMEKYLLLI